MSNSPRFVPNLPHSPGVYLMRDQAGKIVYIGKARDLKKRVASYFAKSYADDPSQFQKIPALLDVLRHIDYVPTGSEKEALVVERRLIQKYKPPFNSMWKDDKSYPFVALTINEDFPRVFLTREKKKRGILYYGPYPSVKRVRRLLNWTWKKKLIPLRPCKFDIKEGHPLPYKKVKSCLYLHTKECSAPCLGRISSKNYKKSAQRAQWFFEGRKDKLIQAWEKEMATSAKRMDYEKAAEVRDRLSALSHVHERITYRELSEPELIQRVGETRAVQDLMSRLNLQRPPETMECFDISHIQGVEKVASMVRFVHGRPEKSQYRKYIIRTVEGIDDFKAMAEVVGRRVRRLKKEGKPLPDLLVIDGGKGQLSFALKALKEEKIGRLSMVALAKREEDVFFPGNSKPLRLPPESPGLLLLRYIRDEAHRFAVGFHRQRRKKRTLGSKTLKK